MNRFPRLGLKAIVIVTMAGWGLSGTSGGGEAESRAIPPAFVARDYLIGRWNGHGVPKDSPAKQFRGWDEKHTWAWMFAQGKPVGLSLTIAGGKVLMSGKLTYDGTRKRYHLEGTQPAPAGKISFEGTLDKSGKYLVLDHVVAGAKSAKSPGKMRLSIWPNANFIRYTMAHDLQEPGSTQFNHLMEVGLTRDGESLGAGATASSSEPAKCIVTGGTATTTVSYQGRTFPVCCSGCADEFNENPGKYLKKASLIEAARTAKSSSGGSTAKGVSRFEDAFARDVDDSASKAKMAADDSGKTAAKSEPAVSSSAADSRAVTNTPAKKEAEKSESATAAARASSLLKRGQNLEKAGNTTAALEYYRQVAKDFANTRAAKTAAEQIKKIEQP